jgi:hypothetical protein
MNTNTDNSLTADHLSNFKDLLVSVGYSHARQWLQSERELALPDEEIERKYDRWRDDNLPVPQWHDLTEKTKDELRDVYLDSFREGVSGPDPASSDKELLMEARDRLYELLKDANNVSEMGAVPGRQWMRLSASIVTSRSTLQKLQSATR